MKTRNSQRLFQRASLRIPGGVNSPVRAFRSVGGNPLFIRRAKGPHIWDADGNRFIDYVGSWGPMILGHADERILRSLRSVMRHGTSFGAPTELEVRMAELIAHLMPSIQMVRMVNSGTEATMSAIRLARAFTGRDAIIKFEGCYHGHADSFLIKAGSGAMTFGVPDSPGVPRAIGNETLTASFNDLASVATLVQERGSSIAAIIVEPVVGNMGCVLPKPGFLAGLRNICTKHGILLIFDEVMTGFRLAPGGAQELFGITPDLTTLGKIIGGGLPVGAYGGRRDIMEMVSPSGPMYQAGTLSGNPLAMAAGLALLSLLSRQTAIYRKLEKMSALLEEGMHENLGSAGIPYRINRAGSMFTLFFTDSDVIDYASAKKSDTNLFAHYFSAMLARGIYLPPAQFEAAFVSTAHTSRIIGETLRAQRLALAKLRI